MRYQQKVWKEREGGVTFRMIPKPGPCAPRKENTAMLHQTTVDRASSMPCWQDLEAFAREGIQHRPVPVTVRSQACLLVIAGVIKPLLGSVFSTRFVTLACASRIGYSQLRFGFADRASNSCRFQPLPALFPFSDGNARAAGKKNCAVRWGLCLSIVDCQWRCP